MTQILLNTGFKHVANVVKNRETYVLDGIMISLDVVTDVGSFIEFELIAKGRDGMESARDRILNLVGSLGLNEEDMVRDSYLEMYLGNKSESVS